MHTSVVYASISNLEICVVAISEQLMKGVSGNICTHNYHVTCCGHNMFILPGTDWLCILWSCSPTEEYLWVTETPTP